MYYHLNIELHADGNCSGYQVIFTNVGFAEPPTWCNKTDISPSFSFGETSGYAYDIKAVVAGMLSPEEPIILELASLGFSVPAAQALVTVALDGAGLED